MEFNWVKSLPVSPKINKKQLEKLEDLRVKYSISNSDFLLAILGSPVFTLKTQEDLYKKLKDKYPIKEDEKILKLMMGARYFEKTENEIDLIMDKIHSFTDLCIYVIKQDEVESPYHKPGVVNKLIDKILS